jgi:uncharacterized protein
VPANDEDRVLEVLDDLECLRLLTTARLGRLGFTDGALPAIVPVPIALEENALVIPAREGNWVVGAMRGSVVAVAVDCYDVDERTGWGVTVIGPSRVLTRDRPDGDGREGGRTPPADGRCSIVVQVGLVRGWRLRLPVASTVEPTDAGSRAG